MLRFLGFHLYAFPPLFLLPTFNSYPPWETVLTLRLALLYWLPAILAAKLIFILDSHCFWQRTSEFWIKHFTAPSRTPPPPKVLLRVVYGCTRKKSEKNPTLKKEKKSTKLFLAKSICQRPYHKESKNTLALIPGPRVIWWGKTIHSCPLHSVHFVIRAFGGEKKSHLASLAAVIDCWRGVLLKALGSWERWAAVLVYLTLSHFHPWQTTCA